MAKTEKFGEIANFRGVQLPKPLKYAYEFDTYANKAIALEANAWPADADSYVLAKINGQSEASAKSVEYQKTLKGLNAAYENTNEYKRAQFIEGALAGKMDPAQANAIADTVPAFQVIPGEVDKMIADYFAKLGQ